MGFDYTGFVSGMGGALTAFFLAWVVGVVVAVLQYGGD